jgi:hypothetical protein
MKKQDNVIEKTKIYLVENCYGDPNKVYIGKTINSRKNSHQQTYGKNIIYNEIDEIFSSNKKDWEPLETYWIEQFKTWGFIIMNIRQKGGSGPEYLTQSQKDKISNNTQRSLKISNNIQRSLKISKALKSKLFKRSGPTSPKPIYQLDPVFNKILKEWHSAADAANELHLNKGNLTQCLKKQRYYKTVGGFAWEYKK